jgi:hypothetical protein
MQINTILLNFSLIMTYYNKIHNSAIIFIKNFKIEKKSLIQENFHLDNEFMYFFINKIIIL